MILIGLRVGDPEEPDLYLGVLPIRDRGNGEMNVGVPACGVLRVDIRPHPEIVLGIEEVETQNRPQVLLETKLAHEKVAKRKIEEALSVFPGVVVAVNALVDATEETENSTTYLDPVEGVVVWTTTEAIMSGSMDMVAPEGSGSMTFDMRMDMEMIAADGLGT